MTYARKQAKGAFRYAAGVPRRGESSESIAVIRSPHKIPPMRGSYTLPEFVPENQGFQIWRNDFGAKNGAQAKRRIEAYLTYARKQAKGAFRCVAGVPRRGARERVRGALPLKGAAVPLPLKGLTPLTKIGFANASIPSPFPQ